MSGSLLFALFLMVVFTKLWRPILIVWAVYAIFN